MTLRAGRPFHGRATMTTPAREKSAAVSSIELFFDLVFVFVITQITQLVEHAHEPADFLKALLVLVPIWWIYAGYAWLTNNVRVTWPMRLVLIAAMAGFLVMAMAIPEVFGAGALAFGLSYLFVVLLHLGAFALKGEGAARVAIFGVAPFNLAVSALLIGAAFVNARWVWLLFLAASSLFVASTILRSERRFTLNAHHFAERHGGVILIVLGESVIAIAMGASASNFGFKGEWLIGVVLSLVLVAALWWSYFDREDRRAADKLIAALPEQRSRMGLLGYWYAHLALIAGIILVAAGIRQLLEGHSGMRLLAGGMAVFMLGDVFFRWVMGMHPIAVRCFGAVLAVALGFAGARWGAQAALAAIALLAIAVIVLERRLESLRA
jgi:low temperature requirement protein LtrA